MENVASLVSKVNQVLQDGEPHNISVDEHSGYTGYRPQAVIDAMNEAFGIGGWGFEEVSSEIAPGEKGGLAISNVKAWITGVDFHAPAWGQNRVTRGDIGDAKKGAQTDALKKALSYFSIGNRAYHGLLEKDKKPTPRALPPSATPVVQAQPASDTGVPQIKELQARCAVVFGVGHFDALAQKALKVTQLPKQYTVADREKIAAYLDYCEKQQAAKTA